MTLRILHVLDHSLPLQSGYVFRTLGLLGGQRGLGWETIQLTTPRNHDSAAASEIVDGWEFHRTPKPRDSWATRPGLREIAEMRAVEHRLDALIASHKPDILHAHSPVLTAIPALRAGKRAGIPVVYEVRGLWEDAAVDHGTTREGDVRYRLTRAMESWVLRRADGVATICQALRQEIAGRGIDAAHIAVAPNAVDLASFAGARAPDAALAEQLGLNGRTVMGFIGSFYHYEGLALLLRSFAAHPAETARTMLLLVGGGPEEARLHALAQSLGLGDRVRFTGRVPHGDVRRYYDLVDIFVYPRHSMRLTELTTPLKPLEAMAQQRLVMASDIGGHRELIQDQVTGYLFPPDDEAALAAAIARVTQDTAAHAAIRDAALHFVQTERNWAAAAAQYRPLYQRVLNRHGKAHLAG